MIAICIKITYVLDFMIVQVDGEQIVFARILSASSVRRKYDLLIIQSKARILVIVIIICNSEQLVFN